MRTVGSPAFVTRRAAGAALAAEKCDYNLGDRISCDELVPLFLLFPFRPPEASDGVIFFQKP